MFSGRERNELIHSNSISTENFEAFLKKIRVAMKYSMEGRFG